MSETVTVDDGMEIVFSRGAGLDIGKRETRCLRSGSGQTPWQTFDTPQAQRIITVVLDGFLMAWKDSAT